LRKKRPKEKASRACRLPQVKGSRRGVRLKATHWGASGIRKKRKKNNGAKTTDGRITFRGLDFVRLYSLGGPCEDGKEEVAYHKMRKQEGISWLSKPEEYEPGEREGKKKGQNFCQKISMGREEETTPEELNGKD